MWMAYFVKKIIIIIENVINEEVIYIFWKRRNLKICKTIFLYYKWMESHINLLL